MKRRTPVGAMIAAAAGLLTHLLWSGSSDSGAPAHPANQAAANSGDPIASGARRSFDPRLPGREQGVAAPSPSTPDSEHGAVTEAAEDACVVDSDCPAGSGCLGQAGRRHCLPSECEVDEHCHEGFVCRTANLTHLGPAVRRCEVVGNRTRGQSCSPSPESSETACARGLLCSFLVCGLPCHPGEADAGCAEDEVCLDTGGGDGAACYPLCTKSGCPEGLECVVVSPTFSRCTKVLGTDCHRVPCPQGQECLTHFTPTGATFECRAPCNPVFGPHCPKGFVCAGGIGVQSFCLEACDPKALAPSCPEGMRCVPVSEDKLVFGCRVRAKPDGP